MGCGSSQPAFDYDLYLLSSKGERSVVVKSESKEEEKGWGVIRRNAKHPHSLVTQIAFPSAPPATTLFEALERGALQKDRPALGTRKFEGSTRGVYEWLSFGDFLNEVMWFGAGLAKLGVTRGKTIGICSANRSEWTISAWAAYSQAMVVVALYDTLGADAIRYIVNHAETSVALTSKEKLQQLLDAMKDCPCLKYIIQFDEKHPKYGNPADTISDAHRQAARNAGVQLLGFSEVMEAGRTSNIKPNPPKPEDLAFIMYTSGTTGVPKGVMLSHENVVSCVAAVDMVVKVTENDRHLSYLPLAHIFETTNQTCLIAKSGAIGFFQGNVKFISDDLKNLRPTVFAGVPRMFSKMYEKVMTGVAQANFIKRAVFNKALNDQAVRARTGQPLLESHDQRIFKKIRTAMGLDQCRFIISGAAPMPAYLLEFLRVAIRPKDGVLQGYGMTETAAAVSVTEADDPTMGHCGPPVPSSEVRLRDVPEMGYSPDHNPPTGEIMVRGPSVFKGYYKNPTATSETFVNGWIATGDIGRWNPTGTLSVIDRKKNIFKIQHGEYVAAESIENTFTKNKLINQCFVYGNSYKSSIIAVIVPHAVPVCEIAVAKNWWPNQNPLVFGSAEFRSDFKTLCETHEADVKAILMAAIKAEAASAKLKPYEIPVDIVIEADLDEDLNGFNQKNECVTPTFKLRRPFLLTRYKERIMAIYSKHGEPPKEGEKW